jgi:hypothetical protein
MLAKLQVSDVQSTVTSERLTLRAVSKSSGYPDDGSDEDNSFARWTPSAELTMTVNNPELLGKFKAGDKVYVDFTPAK